MNIDFSAKAIAITGADAGAGLAVYGAAEAGVNSLTRSIAVEYGRKCIRANAIAPSAAGEGMKT